MTVRAERDPRGIDPEADPVGHALLAGNPVALWLLRAVPRSREELLPSLPPEPRLRREVAAALVSVQTDESSRANARALGEPGTVAVVAGQQPGLFGGPLLTLHKAAAAVNLARHLDGIDGRRVVPVFWLASDDHDLDEARGVHVIGRDGSPRRIALRTPADGRSLHDVEIPEEDSDRALAILGEALPDTPRGREAFALAARTPGGFERWAWACLTRFLGETGLVLASPVALAPLAGETLAEIVEKGETIGSLVRSAGDALRAERLPAVLAPAPGTAPAFVRDGPRGRRRRAAAGDAETARRVRRTPGLASGDVIGRVLLQDRLLPVLAFLAGPTEIAYGAQLRGAHDLLGIPFPVWVPRPRATGWAPRGVAGHAAREWERPTGKPQERVLSPLTPIAAFGLDAVREGLSHLDPSKPGHTVIFVEEESA